jgi:hypothetical protein
MDVLIAVVVTVGLLLCMSAYVQRWQRVAHWDAYLKATPGDRNAVQWSGDPPPLAATAHAFVSMYERTWPLVQRVWPCAAARLAEVGRPRAFAECEAALAGVTGCAPPVDRFVSAYMLMAMVTYDTRLAAALVAADMTGDNLDDAARTHILSLYSPVLAIDASPVGDLIAKRWELSPFRHTSLTAM